MLLRAFSVAVVFALACAAPPTPGGDHAHGPDEHGHDHGESVERPGLSFTVYADGLELFMETPAFVVGEPSPLVAHFTDARDAEGFVWVTEGQVTATLRYGDGFEEHFAVDHLLRSGIFKPVVVPTRAGPASLTLRLGGPVSGVVPVGEVQVHSSSAAAVRDGGVEDAQSEAVSYLKEAQWKTIFATAPAEVATLRGAVRASGELVTPPGAGAQLSSPVAGRLQATPLLRVGAQVRAGDLLARVVGLGGADRGGVEAELAEAEAELARLTAAERRAAALHPAVVSAQALEEAQAATQVARARLAGATARGRAWAGGAAGGAELRSPIDGQVAFVRALPGSGVDAGELVVEIVDPRELWLHARVYEAEAALVTGTSGAMFTVAGRAEPVLVDAAHGGQVVAVGPAVDPLDRTVPVIFAFPNPGDLRPGAWADVQVFTAERIDAVVVPVDAVVDENGLEYVYVMEGGESFFKRRVRLGVRDGDRVAIQDGVEAGERVVSRGAYELLLSTTLGAAPAHGHAH